MEASSLLKIPADSGISPGIFFRHTQNNGGHILRHGWTAWFAWNCLHIRPASFGANPLQECLVVDYPKNLPDCAAKRRPKSDEYGPFSWRSLDCLRQPGTQTAVFRFQVCNLAKGCRMCDINYKCEERIVVENWYKGIDQDGQKWRILVPNYCSDWAGSKIRFSEERRGGRRFLHRAYGTRRKDAK